MASTRSATTLPEGMALPGSFGRVMAFIPNWPLTLLQLKSVTVQAVAVDLLVANNTMQWTDPKRTLSLACVVWPLITAIYLSAALTETVCKQWVWYRLLQHRVIMDFESSEKGLFGRVFEDRGCWWLTFGFVLMVASAYVNGLDTMDSLGTFVSLIMMHVFFVTEAESSQLPTVNGFVKGDFDQNVIFLKSCTWVKESAVIQAAASQWRFEVLAANAVELDAALKPRAATNTTDKFWAMQLLGLAPLSSILDGC